MRRNPPAAKLEPGLWSALKAAGQQWAAHKSARMGAALAYYSVFSLGPLIVVVISIAALIFDRSVVQREVIQALQGLLGDQGSEAVNAMLSGAGSRGEGWFASIIGTATLLFAAVGVVVQLKDALNTMWGVTDPPGEGLWEFVRAHIFSLAGVLTAGFLFLISMLLTAAFSAMGSALGSFLSVSVLQVVTAVISFAVIALLFMLMFRYLPDADVRWADVWAGGLLTAALFEVGRFAIAFYIGKQGLESTYGASASIVIVLIWVYYSAQIVLFGAEFTRARAQQRGYEPPVEAARV